MRQEADTQVYDVMSRAMAKTAEAVIRARCSCALSAADTVGSGVGHRHHDATTLIAGRREHLRPAEEPLREVMTYFYLATISVITMVLSAKVTCN